ncbi:MAG: bifunctional 3,4-dihydroxy-2-butanone-4-phosphate synthase/GTP cyclohydrolase II [SAR324 cluster bacterium]|nr:bifunctional 3,4-dihydroxy-2-butanone-4-phosphate synthase/GTP cyclohydrolase II [SAR324 cluster bacterium]
MEKPEQEKSSTKFDTLEDAIADIRAGKFVILMDDEDRENEGDLCIAAEKITPDDINFMATHGRGLICLTLDEEQVEKLDLPMMTFDNRSPFKTNFTVSIEAAKGVTTGISTFDRATTIKAAIKKDATPKDVVMPGHVFPLRAVKGGVLRRAGQTEGSVDLAKLAGLNSAGVICEILAKDGSMARYPALREFASKHQLKIVTIKDLIQYRLRNNSFVKRVDQARLPTKVGNFEIIGFKNELNDENYIVLKQGSWKKGEPVLVRVHSQCLTGDVFGSLRCDCQEQLQEAMRLIDKEGKGVILYLPQEGRGIGILNKIKAYHLQDEGKDTVEANEALGFSADLRDYGFGAQVLVQLDISKLRIITNNPKKIIALKGYNLEVVERVPIVIKANKENAKYLQTKKTKLGHIMGI